MRAGHVAVTLYHRITALGAATVSRILRSHITDVDVRQSLARYIIRPLERLNRCRLDPHPVTGVVRGEMQRGLPAEALHETHQFPYELIGVVQGRYYDCLLYTSDAADDLLCVDLGGRRIIKKKKTNHYKQH